MEAGQNSIHEAGEGGWSVTETKGNLVELKQLPAAGSKRSFLFVLLCYRYLPIATLQIQSGKPLSPMESVQEVINPRQRVGILDSSRVELTKVNTKPQAAVLLSHHYYWRSPWAVGGSNDITGQHLLYLCHFFPPDCGVLPPVKLAERRPMGLDPMLQQRSVTQVFVPLTKDVLVLLK